jgi:hypothetical protein
VGAAEGEEGLMGLLCGWVFVRGVVEEVVHIAMILRTCPDRQVARRDGD